MEREIQSLLWEWLETGEDEPFRYLSEEQVEEIYENGFVDIKRVTLEGWKKSFEYFPKSEGRYQVTQEGLKRVAPLLYRGPIREPFDPHRLRDGPRPLSWLNELFRKILRFETNLTLVDWDRLLKRDIHRNFVSKEHFLLNKTSRQYIQSLLEGHCSPLRRLELWVQGGASRKEGSYRQTQPPSSSRTHPGPIRPECERIQGYQED